MWCWIFFLLLFGIKGLKGAAIATVIAEAASVIFCILYVRFKIPFLRFKENEFVLDVDLFRVIINYSFVAAMQQITLHLRKLLVQGAVNP